MSDLLRRLKAMRGGVVPDRVTPAGTGDRELTDSAEALQARLVEADGGVHMVREVRLPGEARHGHAPLGGAGLHPLLLPRLKGGHVLYVDTETTGLSGGTGILAFLIGVGRHDSNGFAVRQLLLPGPEHERAQLHAFRELAEGAGAVVTYNGGSFDLPLLRNRFAMHGLSDPLAGVPHLDLLTLARRLWRSTLPDCTLGTVERSILGARRGLEDVPGMEVPARYLAWLRSRDPWQLSGVLSHNSDDIVALTALRQHIELLLQDPERGSPAEQHGIGLWLDRAGEAAAALERLLAAAAAEPQAAWHASLLLKRQGRLSEAAGLWAELGRTGRSAAWVELAKLQEHRQGDLRAALASVEAALACSDADVQALAHRRERLLRRLSPGPAAPAGGPGS